ncbi:MAG: hypothetical protein LUE91_01510 [Oscillospiraceae bacterium]|nr:hypothetical protein [Oscillospiraceae bacterium]
MFGYGQDIKRQDAILILYNWLGDGVVVDIDNPFSDLSESSYAYDAVLWAYSVGVTAGTTAPTVDEDGNVTTQGILNGTGTCKRAQMVAFLYRCGVEAELI